MSDKSVESKISNDNASKSNIVKGLVGAIGIITVLTILSRIIGFSRWIAQASYVGTGIVADAYASANQIPNVLFEIVVGGALAGLTVPLLANAVSKNIKKDINNISSALLSWSLIILIPLSVGVYFAADWITSLLPVSQNTNADLQFSLTVLFLKIFALQIPFYGVGVILTGILQSHKKFLWPVLMPIFSSIVVITTYYVFGYLTKNISNPADIPLNDIRLLGWGTTFGVFMLSVPLFIPVYRLGVRFNLNLKLERDLLRNAFYLGFAGIGALIAQQISVFVTLYLAKSSGEVGTINIFQYTQAIYVLPYAILAVPIATAVFPYISEYAAKGDKEAFRNVCVGSSNLIVFLSLLGASGLIVVANGVEGLFQILANVDGMAVTLKMMAPGLVGLALIFHISRCLYAIHASMGALISTVIGWGAVIFSQIAYAGFLNIGGGSYLTLSKLGVGQTIGMFVAGILLLHTLGKHIGVNLITMIVQKMLLVSPLFVLGVVVANYVASEIFVGNGVFDSFMNALISGVILLICVVPSVFVLGKAFFEPSAWK